MTLRTDNWYCWGYYYCYWLTAGQLLTDLNWLVVIIVIDGPNWYCGKWTMTSWPVLLVDIDSRTVLMTQPRPNDNDPVGPVTQTQWLAQWPSEGSWPRPRRTGPGPLTQWRTQWPGNWRPSYCWLLLTDPMTDSDPDGGRAVANWPRPSGPDGPNWAHCDPAWRWRWPQLTQTDGNDPVEQAMVIIDPSKWRTQLLLLKKTDQLTQWLDNWPSPGQLTQWLTQLSPGSDDIIGWPSGIYWQLLL